jgi:hypothetical protein
MLDAIADHGFGRRARGGSYGRDLKTGIQGLRVGFVRHFHETDMPADPEVAKALQEAAQILSAEGAVVRTVQLPPLQTFGAVNRILCKAGGLQPVEPPQALGGRLHLRRRIRGCAKTARQADRCNPRGLWQRGHSTDGKCHGPALRDRQRERHRAHLSASGPSALQRDRTSRHRLDGRPFKRSVADRPSARRPVLGRGDDASRRVRVRACDGLARRAAARRDECGLGAGAMMPCRPVRFLTERARLIAFVCNHAASGPGRPLHEDRLLL